MKTIDKIVSLLKSSCKSQVGLANHLGVGKNVITDWKAGRTNSYMKYIPQIAEFFDVTPDYLLSDESSMASKTEPTPTISSVMKSYLALSDEDKVEFGQLITLLDENK